MKWILWLLKKWALHSFLAKEAMNAKKNGKLCKRNASSGVESLYPKKERTNAAYNWSTNICVLNNVRVCSGLV